jgi:hypothetical protein
MTVFWKLFVLVLLGMAISCETLAPQAKAVRIAAEPAEVADCRMVGSVSSQPPYMGPNDGVNQLRNEAAALGADTLLLTSTGAMRGKNGMAYSCGSRKP